MRKINYPLIISDFDGTLLRGDGTIAEETKKTIDEYMRLGGRFAICTGRTLSSILPRANELGLKGLVACYQGSVIADIETGELKADGFLPTDGAAAICRAMEELGLHIHVYEMNKYYSNMDDAALKAYEKISGEKGIVYEEKPLSSWILERGIKVRKVLALVAPEEKAAVYQALESRFGNDYYVTYSAAFLVEITSRKYSKGSAVRFIADYYGVDIAKTIAVGDSLNDLPMIEAAGLGIAVQNADELLKKRAKVTLDYTNDENAVGKIVEKYGFGGKV